MLKIILYSAMEHKYASRAISKACLRGINYIWLLDGEPAPSYRTLCRFRSELLSECAQKIFYGLTHKFNALGEIAFEHLFVDGTKLEANANKYSFVWKKSTSKYETRVLERLSQTVKSLCLRYGLLCDTPEIVLEQLYAKSTAPFVYGRGKRKSELQKDIEQLPGRYSGKGYGVAFEGTSAFIAKR